MGLLLLKGLFKLAKGIFKRFFAIRLLKWLDLGAAEWGLVGMAALIAVTSGMFIWSGALKIRLRRRLGEYALALGVWEIAFIAMHLVLFVVFCGLVAAVMIANPEMDEQELDKVLLHHVRWLGAVSGSIVGIWLLLTARFFLAVRARRFRDWRQAVVPDALTTGRRFGTGN